MDVRADAVVGNRVLGVAEVDHSLRVEFLLAARCWKTELPSSVDFDASVGNLGLVLVIDRRLDQEGAMLAHVVQWRQLLVRGRFGQAFDVLEDVAVVFVDSDALSLPVRRFEVLADAERAVVVDAPGELNPELVLLPHLARIGFVGEARRLPLPPGELAQHRLAERNPHPGVRLVGVDVVPLGGVPHRQHVVGEKGGLVPGRSERNMAADRLRVREHLNPRETVGVGPDRVEDPREVDVHAAAAVLDKVRQDLAHLVVGKRVFGRPDEFVPSLLRWRHVKEGGVELGPGAGRGPPFGADRACQDVQQVQRARHLPAAEVTDGARPPDMGREPAAGARDHLRDLGDLLDRHLTFGGGELEGVFRVLHDEPLDEALECRLVVRVRGRHPLWPVDPFLDEATVIELLDEYITRDSEEQR